MAFPGYAMIIFGTRLMGRCDEVPGLFHVATRFFHIDFLPLVPTQSYIILSQKGNQFNGMKIPMNGKSILLAWGRAIALAATVGSIIGAIVSLLDDRTDLGSKILFVLAAAACTTFFWFVMWSRPCSKASAARARELGQLVGLNQAGWAMVEQHCAGAGATPANAAFPSPAQAMPAFGASPTSAQAQPMRGPALPPPLVTAIPAAALYPCRSCGKSFPIEQSYSEADGQTICHACWNAANATSTRTA